MSNIKLNKIFKTVCIASDHAGFKLKEMIKNYLIDKRVPIIDLGPFNDRSVDYPDFAKNLQTELSLKKVMLESSLWIWYGYGNKRQ